jgi:hypothetical protein
MRGLVRVEMFQIIFFDWGTFGLEFITLALTSAACMVHLW